MRQRRGVTLIELLIVLAIITVLATLIIAAAPRFGERHRAARGAGQLQSWLNLAKQRAMRDQRPVGIRLPHIVGQPYVRELLYVEMPAEGVGGSVTVPYSLTPSPSPYLFIKLTTTVLFSPADPTALVRPGDVVNLANYAMANCQPRRIVNVIGPPESSPPYSYQLQLDQALPLPTSPAPSPPGQFLPLMTFTTQQHQFARKARPIVGEPVLQFPQDIAIDIDLDSVGGTWHRMFPLLANTGGTQPFDILFSPGGQVIGYEGNIGSRICLWVRDVSLNTTGALVNGEAHRTDPRFLPPGENTLITVYTRTGHVASHPIDPAGLEPNPSLTVKTWNPFKFTQDGLSSSQ